MRQTISGLVAAIAVVIASAAPALACGGGGLFQSPCSPCGQEYVNPCAQPGIYVAPAPSHSHSGCDSGCGGWTHGRLQGPAHRYYFVNQGPTYTGPGHLLIYRESAVHRYRAHPHFRHGHAPHHGMRHSGASHVHGHHERMMHGHMMRHHD